MVQTLLLTSGGIVPEVRDYFLSLLLKKPEENKVTFMTTAAYGKTKNPAWMEKDKQLLYYSRLISDNYENLDKFSKEMKEFERFVSKEIAKYR